jgi:hypothetical protein
MGNHFTGYNAFIDRTKVDTPLIARMARIFVPYRIPDRIPTSFRYSFNRFLPLDSIRGNTGAEIA